MKDTSIQELLQLEAAVQVETSQISHLLKIHQSVRLIVEKCLDQHMAHQNMQEELRAFLDKHDETFDINQLRTDLLFAIHLCLNALDYRVE